MDGKNRDRQTAGSVVGVVSLGITVGEVGRSICDTLEAAGALEEVGGEAEIRGTLEVGGALEIEGPLERVVCNGGSLAEDVDGCAVKDVRVSVVGGTTG